MKTGENDMQLNQWYSDTDQDVEGFVEEFYWFVIGIMDDMILLNPRYLLLEEVMEQFLLLMPETDVDAMEQAGFGKISVLLGPPFQRGVRRLIISLYIRKQISSEFIQ